MNNIELKYCGRCKHSEWILRWPDEERDLWCYEINGWAGLCCEKWETEDNDTVN